MGGETGARSARRAKRRTCLKCDGPLPESTRPVPRLFCSWRHAASGALMSVFIAVVLIARLSHLWALFD
ncbi:hypothetical protein AB0N17_29900 [Streptomyces sp. NPDC051133]|uniref:hypothetical protein n=1 Tax=Streptomyces sp. NPDC051133 TaxID=3155521 RepID=UPI0034496569